MIKLYYHYHHYICLFFSSIVLVPDNASKLFRKLIESLLITHADCKLNQIGHLLSRSQVDDSSSNVNPNDSLKNIWCSNLTRRP